MRQRASAQIHEFKRIIEHPGIRSIRVNNRLHLSQIFSEHFALEQGLTGMHPVNITAKGIDLTVVNHEAVWMRAFPAWERICTKTGMY
ncbi:hypothetical protein D3C81_1134310 [compost metagenome]